MYTGMAISRNTEVTLRWSRTQMFMLINSALFTLLFTKDAGLWLFAGLGFFGVIIGVIWFLINRKTQQWVDYWQTRLAQITHTDEPNMGTVNVFVGAEWDKINKGATFYKLLYILPILFGALWISIFVFSFTKL